MKRNIMIYYSQLNIGGAEKSLIRLMNAFVNNGDAVTYLGRYGGGKGEYLLDERVRQIYLSKRPPQTDKNIISVYLNMVCLIQRWLTLFTLWVGHRKYDICFVGLQGLSPNNIEKYVHPKKIAVFIRNDIAKFKDNSRVLQMLQTHVKSVDYYICVAGTVRDSLIKVLPEASEKVVVIYNLLNVEEMKRNLQEAPNPFDEETDGVLKILTVCRISDVSKGILRMVRICRRLVDEGYHFRWYIVGDGPDFPMLQQAIHENHLEDVMRTPGRVNNPFGYYRECDLVAMLSYYEGLCGVVNEAKISGKAIIATVVSGVYEQLEHGVNGWVVENDEEHIMEGMRYLLSNQNLIKHLTNCIYSDAILNDHTKLEQLNKLIDDK